MYAKISILNNNTFHYCNSLIPHVIHKYLFFIIACGYGSVSPDRRRIRQQKLWGKAHEKGNFPAKTHDDENVWTALIGY